MPLLKILLFMVVVLPGILVRTLWGLLREIMDENDWWWNIPYVLMVILITVAIILYLNGYR